MVDPFGPFPSDESVNTMILNGLFLTVKPPNLMFTADFCIFLSTSFALIRSLIFGSCNCIVRQHTSYARSGRVCPVTHNIAPTILR